MIRISIGEDVPVPVPVASNLSDLVEIKLAATDPNQTVDPSILLATATAASTSIITGGGNGNAMTDTSNILKLTIVNPTTPNIPTGGETTTTSTTKTSTYHETTGITTTVSEDSYDQSLFKLILTVQEGDSYYNAGFQVGTNSSSGKNAVDLRLDLIQPELWVMNGNDFYDCNFINSWFSSEEVVYNSTSVYPAAVTTEPEYIATVCGQGGLYFTPTPSASDDSIVLPTATIEGVKNGNPYVIPYMNVIEATGVFETDDIYFNTTNNHQVVLSNFTFINVNDTNMYFGGLGLAGLPQGSGFLYTLTSLGIIQSPSYSLWFNNCTEGTGESFGELLPGVIDQKYYSGDLYAFEIPDHSGIRFPSDNNLDIFSNTALKDLVLPILQLDDLLVENQLNGETISLLSTPGDSIALILDSRSSYNYIPLDMIVNLAIQTNAYYSNEAERWIVQCDVITGSQATLNFIFGGLEVPIPLQDFIVDANYYGKTLKFSNGEKACYLTFLPSSLNGFNSLGLPFITNIYLAVDNAGKSIALANANRNLQVSKSALEPTGKVQPFTIPTSTAALSISTLNQTNVSATLVVAHSSIGYIQSGFIPFAISQSYAPDVTLTYSSIDGSEESGVGVNLDIPARFSGAVIRSGEIIITAGATNSLASNTTTLLPGVASAASENATTSKNGGNSFKSKSMLINGTDPDFKQIFFILSLLLISICIL
ncbi:aspartic peptidase domain-containing protein [Scheffersomyces coipomensis]|uniref:aspartic peptidase domain-containing protein n=1 Tax=Scheffersomyces coipomensis TaxID=1788519 RepID=UPI00315DEB15